MKSRYIIQVTQVEIVENTLCRIVIVIYVQQYYYLFIIWI